MNREKKSLLFNVEHRISAFVNFDISYVNYKQLKKYQEIKRQDDDLIGNGILNQFQSPAQYKARRPHSKEKSFDNLVINNVSVKFFDLIQQ